jgi:signal transduction histidine kinase
MVSISDTGPGVPEGELKAIFAPFVTTKQQGTGLGLSICQTIIGNYGGAIWVENGANGGQFSAFPWI